LRNSIMKNKNNIPGIFANKINKTSRGDR